MAHVEVEVHHHQRVYFDLANPDVPSFVETVSTMEYRTVHLGNNFAPFELPHHPFDMGFAWGHMQGPAPVNDKLFMGREWATHVLDAVDGLVNYTQLEMHQSPTDLRIHTLERAMAYDNIGQAAFNTGNTTSDLDNKENTRHSVNTMYQAPISAATAAENKDQVSTGERTGEGLTPVGASGKTTYREDRRIPLCNGREGLGIVRLLTPDSHPTRAREMRVRGEMMKRIEEWQEEVEVSLMLEAAVTAHHHGY